MASAAPAQAVGRRGGTPTPRTPGDRSFLGAWTATALALLLVVVWSRTLRTPYLAFPLVPLPLALALAWRARRGGSGEAAHALLPLALAMGTVAVSLALAGAAAYELSRVGPAWEALLTQRERNLAAELDNRMAPVVRSGREAAAAGARIAATPSAHGLFADLALAQRRTGVAAIAVIDSTGQLVAWAGEHRGQLPEAVRAPGPPVQYLESPLFSYLYFSAPSARRGERAVAAILLQTGLPGPQPATEGFADRFAAALQARPVFGPGAAPDAAWSLSSAGQVVVHASFQRLTQSEWRDSMATQGRRAVLVTVLIGLMFLAWSWLRRPAGRRPRRSGVPLAIVALAAALAPVGRVAGVPRLFSPGFFMLPYVPLVISLGAGLAVLLPVGAFVAGMSPARLRGRVGAWALPAAMLLVAVTFAVGLYLLLAGATAPLLEGGATLWLGFQLVATLLLTIFAAAVFPGGAAWPGRRNPERARGVSRGFVSAGAAVAALLALVVVGQAQGEREPSLWLAALWAIPFGLMVIGLTAGGAPPRLGRWLAAGWLAVTAVLPFVWSAHVDARLRAAEREVATLGNGPDPFLTYLLGDFAGEVQRRHELGEVGLELLYRTWVGSGFADEAYPARIRLWDAAGPQRDQLALGGAAELGAADTVPAFLYDLVREARRTQRAQVVSVQNVESVNQAMAVPIDSTDAVTVVVPPRRELKRSAGLAPFLGNEDSEDTQLSLVRVKPGVPLPPRQLQWARVPQGWRGEQLVHYPESDYHAHVFVVLPSPWVRLARAFLLAALDSAILLLLWGIGRIARGEYLAPPGGWSVVVRGFRARVTAALFLFFLLPTAAFGLAAYQALAGEVVRSAAIVAQNGVRQAAREFWAASGDLRALSTLTEEDLLYYNGGELMGASDDVALELGLYDAWMPPDVYQVLQSGENEEAVQQQELTGHPYIVAYQRLPVAAMLAVPVPLAAGETAVRQRELAHLILFAVLMGGLLTLGLSLAVGRALATPIGQLSRAAALVGAGRLRVHLPEDRPDEFGQLFGSFNRMARRLRRARTQEVRSARVLAWGEMARQVAHEIKNPLTPIKLSVQHIRRAHNDRRADFPQILQSNVDQILAEIDRLSEIARAFSRYGAPSDSAGPLEPVDVGAVVQDALTLYRAGDADVSYLPLLDGALPRCIARAGELKEVVLNLVENARTALDGRRGTIAVEAHAFDGQLELVVRDDGPGIPAELLPRVFEPHFSTRSTGTGLGLAIVRRLVESWGGSVTAESEPGAGTVVRVRLRVAGQGGGGEQA